MENKIKVIIADDQDIYLDGLERNLNETGDIKVVASAANGKKLVELVNQYDTDIVLTDISMPVMNGIEAIGLIQKLGKKVKSIVLTTYDDKYLIVDAIKAGAVGYVLKGGHKSDIINAIKMVYEDAIYYCELTKKNIAEIIRENSFSHPLPVVKPELFTHLERKIIHYICEEKTSKEIGLLLHMGKRSVEKQRNIIFDKTAVKHFAGLIKYALLNHLYPAPPSLLEDRQ